MEPHGDLSSEEYRALAEFRFEIRRFIHFSEHAARAAGMEPQQHQLLLALKGLPTGGRVTIGDLAERLQLQHHSVVELIDRSERQGLVARNRGTADRRQVFISLTAHGDALLRELSLHHRRELRSAGPALVRALRALIDDADGAIPLGATPDEGDETPTAIT